MSVRSVGRYSVGRWGEGREGSKVAACRNPVCGHLGSCDGRGKFSNLPQKEERARSHTRSFWPRPIYILAAVHDSPPVRQPAIRPLPIPIARFSVGGPEITGECGEAREVNGGGLHATTSLAAVYTVSNV